MKKPGFKGLTKKQIEIGLEEIRKQAEAHNDDLNRRRIEYCEENLVRAEFKVLSVERSHTNAFRWVGDDMVREYSCESAMRIEDSQVEVIKFRGLVHVKKGETIYANIFPALIDYPVDEQGVFVVDSDIENAVLLKRGFREEEYAERVGAIDGGWRDIDSDFERFIFWHEKETARKNYVPNLGMRRGKISFISRG